MDQFEQIVGRGSSKSLDDSLGVSSLRVSAMQTLASAPSSPRQPGDRRELLSGTTAQQSYFSAGNSPREAKSSEAHHTDSVMEGYLLKLGDGIMASWKRRFFCLHNSGLLDYYSAASKKPSEKRGVIALAGSTIRTTEMAESGKAFSFSIHPEGIQRVYHLCADSDKDRDRWLRFLSNFGAGPIKIDKEHISDKAKDILFGGSKAEGNKIYDLLGTNRQTMETFSEKPKAYLKLGVFEDAKYSSAPTSGNPSPTAASPPTPSFASFNASNSASTNSSSSSSGPSGSASASGSGGPPSFNRNMSPFGGSSVGGGGYHALPTDDNSAHPPITIAIPSAKARDILYGGYKESGKVYDLLGTNKQTIDKFKEKDKAFITMGGFEQTRMQQTQDDAADTKDSPASRRVAPSKVEAEPSADKPKTARSLGNVESASHDVTPTTVHLDSRGNRLPALKIIKRGLLTKMGKINTKSFKERYFVLTWDNVWYYPNANEIAPIAGISLSYGASVELDDSVKYNDKVCFSLTPNDASGQPARKFLLFAADRREAEEWVRAVQTALRSASHSTIAPASSPAGSGPSNTGNSGTPRKVRVSIGASASVPLPSTSPTDASRPAAAAFSPSNSSASSALPLSPTAVNVESRPYTHTRSLAGFLRKRGEIRKSWKKRFFVLSSYLLFYFESEFDASPAGEKEGRKPLGYVDVRGGKLQEESAAEYSKESGLLGSISSSLSSLSSSFRTTANALNDATSSALPSHAVYLFSLQTFNQKRMAFKGRKYLFYAESKRERDDWMDALRKAAESGLPPISSGTSSPSPIGMEEEEKDDEEESFNSPSEKRKENEKGSAEEKQKLKGSVALSSSLAGFSRGDKPANTGTYASASDSAASASASTSSSASASVSSPSPSSRSVEESETAGDSLCYPLASKEGWLWKLGDTVANWKRRYFVLEKESARLRYFEKKPQSIQWGIHQEELAKTKPGERGQIPLSGAMVTEEPQQEYFASKAAIQACTAGSGFLFSIQPIESKRKYVIACPSEDSRNRWMESVRVVSATALSAQVVSPFNLKEGYLYRLSDETGEWQRSFVVLSSLHLLSAFSSHLAVGKGARADAVLSLEDAKIQLLPTDHFDRSFTFSIASTTVRRISGSAAQRATRTWICAAESRQEMEEWTNTILNLE